jgi:hypothetical protein
MSLNISNNNLSGFRDSVDVPANSKVGDCFGEHEVIIFKHPNPSMAQVTNFSGINALADSIKDNGAISFAVLFDDGDVNDTVFEHYITKQSGSGPHIQVGDKVTITWPARYRGENHPAIITAGPAKNKGALTSLNLSSNFLDSDPFAEAVKVTKYPAVIWHHLHVHLTTG